MEENQKKLQVLKDAIDKRLKTLYQKDETERCNEAKTLEYLMCIIEADANDDEYATKCLRVMYL
ncbi:MAG: hypothetical protein WCR19_03285 [Acholeplasmataceae bacterium]